MAPRGSRFPSLRLDKLDTLQIRAPGASIAHPECSEATSRHGEAVEAAGHDEVDYGGVLPDLRRTMASKALRLFGRL
jgi:hypothetical protein